MRDDEDETMANGTDGVPSRPQVTIALPVLNGAETVRRAIDAVLAQSFEDFELLISENGSSDQTLEICKAAALRDARIRIIAHPVTITAVENFRTPLSQARGAFFMFVAADDWIEPNFVEEALHLLQLHPDAAACVPRTLLHFGPDTVREALGSSELMGPDWSRPARFLLNPRDNSRIYGLYHTPIMRWAFLDESEFHAFDWAISALTLSRGAHVQSTSIILHREGSDRVKYIRQNFAQARTWLDVAFPVRIMTVACYRNLSGRQRWAAVFALLILNIRKSIEGVRFARAARGALQPDVQPRDARP